jgi:hypothetical protein
MDMLHVKNDRIVDELDNPIWLRGTCVGGWMNMENFLDGYPGAEHQMRAHLAQELGESKARFFFDRLLDHFFAEEDVAYIKSLGATVVRLSLNYRHFESDAHPFEYLEPGFQRLDQAVGWCTNHGLYIILDMHSVQGWQNTDWHCDNASRHVLFWHDKCYQDRFIALWQEIARRYKGNPTIAGYNIMNEPLVNTPFGRFRENSTPDLASYYRPDWERINRIYRRAVEDIRQVDPEHIIFLEGDYFSNLFMGLKPPIMENLVYSSHNYNAGPEERWDFERQHSYFLGLEGTQYTQKYNVPLWVGEFGTGCALQEEEQRLRLQSLDAQIQVFNQYSTHWTIWNYKDIGAMSLVWLHPDSAYMRAIRPVLEAKRALDIDWFSFAESVVPIKQKLAEIARLVESVINDPTIDPVSNQGFMAQHLLGGYISTLMQPSYARCFTGMSEEKIDDVLQSFELKNCIPCQPLVNVLNNRFLD